MGGAYSMYDDMTYIRTYIHTYMHAYIHTCTHTVLIGKSEGKKQLERSQHGW
jgi:hypothetical protein